MELASGEPGSAPGEVRPAEWNAVAARAAPLDPLELALLMEAAEDLADLDRDDPPLGEMVAEDGGPDDEER